MNEFSDIRVSCNVRVDFSIEKGPKWHGTNFSQVIFRESTGVCGQGLSYVFAAPPIKYFVIFLRLSIANPNPNLKP